jgi:hypothetical protein
MDLGNILKVLSFTLHFNIIITCYPFPPFTPPAGSFLFTCHLSHAGCNVVTLIQLYAEHRLSVLYCRTLTTALHRNIIIRAVEL